MESHSPLFDTLTRDTSRTSLAAMFDRIIKDRNSARKCLGLAVDVIHELETYAAELTSVLAETQATLAEHLGGSLNNSLYTKLTSQVSPGNLIWIADTWICFPANESLLGAVEHKWMRGELQRALNDLDGILKSTSTLEDNMKCGLLHAAMLCSCDQPDQALKFIDQILKQCEEHRSNNCVLSAREISGIAHFLRGKAFMLLKDWNEAYWAFSRALFVPGYQHKATELKARVCLKLCEPRNPAPTNQQRGHSRRETHLVDSDFSWEDDEIAGLNEINDVWY
ncbi:hypothetical protein FQN57_000769 [Myotisia sp. PD_48]|nr:hypothetical protein FQN57_000769 [Myotisia sp. PD_48]